MKEIIHGSGILGPFLDLVELPIGLFGETGVVDRYPTGELELIRPVDGVKSPAAESHTETEKVVGVIQVLDTTSHITVDDEVGPTQSSEEHQLTGELVEIVGDRRIEVLVEGIHLPHSHHRILHLPLGIGRSEGSYTHSPSHRVTGEEQSLYPKVPQSPHAEVILKLMTAQDRHDLWRKLDNLVHTIPLTYLGVLDEVHTLFDGLIDISPEPPRGLDDELRNPIHRHGEG